MTLRDEWGIRYLDTHSISMAGPVFITTVVQSEEIARTAATWTFGEWKSRDVQVVRRQVTEWEEVG